MQRAVVLAVVLLVAGGLLFLLLGDRSAPEDETGPARPARPEAVDQDPMLHGAGEARTETMEGTEGGAARLVSEAAMPERGNPLVVTGRVVDDHRRPQADVSIEVIRSSGPPLDGGRTDRAGRFEASVPRRPSTAGRVLVQATHADGRTGISLAPRVTGDTTRRDVGTITLRPASSLEIRVVDAEGTPVEGASVALFRWVVGEVAPLRADHTGARGTATFPTLVDGTYRVVASVRGRGRGAIPVQVPTSEPAVLRLGPTASLSVRVVDQDTEKGIPNATVFAEEVVAAPTTPMGHAVFASLWPPPTIPRTDDDGRTRIEGFGPEDELWLCASADGYPQGLPGMRAVSGVKVATGTTTITLGRNRTITFPVGAGDGPQPPEGAKIALENAFGATGRFPSHIVMEGDNLVGHGFERKHVHVRAVAPDGSLATLLCHADSATGSEAVFRTPRFIDVVVTEADGRPATGFYVRAHDVSNTRRAGPVLLDERGEARLGPLSGHRMNVYLNRTAENYGGPWIGLVNLEKGDRRVEHVLAPSLQVVLDVFVNGERGLPGTYRLLASYATVGLVAEDPIAGTLRFAIHPTSNKHGTVVRLWSAGYLRVELPLETDVASELVRRRVEFDSGARILLALKPPADGLYDLRAERLDEDGWSARWAGPSSLHPDTSSRLEIVEPIGPLSPGRWRITDVPSGAASAEVEIHAGTKEVPLGLDLSRAGPVRGRVLVPDGFRAQDARVRYEMGVRGGPGEHAGETNAGPEGSFELRIAGDLPIRLTPWHPELVPAAQSASLEVTGPRDGLVLELVQSDPTRFRIGDRDDLAPARTPGEEALTDLRVARYAADFEGAALGEHVARVDRAVPGGFAVADLPRGRWALLVDIPGWAPLLLPDVEIGSDGTDLGTYGLRRGSSVRVRVRPPEEGATPSLVVVAQASGPLPYTRHTSSGGESEVWLTGLGRGTFSLIVMPTPGTSQGDRLVKVIEVDGTSDVIVDYEPR